jgi:putative membrane protein
LHKKLGGKYLMTWFKSAFLGVLLVMAVPVAAHSGDAAVENWWTAWSFSLDLMLPMALVVWIYTRGALRRRARSARVASGLEPSFFALGLLALFLSLESPIDPLGERSYTMHQVQHLLLRSLAPLLLFLPSPQATFVAGLPSRVRRLFARMSRVLFVRVFFGVLTHPVSVTVLFIVSGYVWQYPSYFEAALLDDGLHYLMHVTMLAAGVLFWWRIFDDRPSSTPHGGRIVMLLSATAANVALGAYLTLKEGVLYPVYDELGRLWLGGEYDELLGGIILWIPGSNMALLALLVILHRWGQREDRLRSKAVRLEAAAPAVGANSQPRAAGTVRLGVLLGLMSGGIFLGFLGFIAVKLIGG